MGDILSNRVISKRKIHLFKFFVLTLQTLWGGFGSSVFKEKEDITVNLDTYKYIHIKVPTPAASVSCPPPHNRRDCMQL
jgi:hypothetical protein